MNTLKRLSLSLPLSLTTALLCLSIVTIVDAVNTSECDGHAMLQVRRASDDANVSLQEAFFNWWPQTRKLLRDEWLKTRAPKAEAWATAFDNYVTIGLDAVDWVQGEGSPLHKETYVELYESKLANRTLADIPVDNLFEIAHRAEGALWSSAKLAYTCKEYLGKVNGALIESLAKQRDRLVWSQGSLGPRIYQKKFLETFANAMVSDALWQHPGNLTEQETTFAGNKAPLEAGVFYIDSSVEYPLHFHEELEAYFILGGTTRFVWLEDGQLTYKDRDAGEWHVNPPNIPHSIVTPLPGQYHLSFWFREGGPGQAANNRYGPKWIDDVSGLKTNFDAKQYGDATLDGELDGDIGNFIPENLSFLYTQEGELDKENRYEDPDHLVGSLGMSESVLLPAYAASIREIDPKVWAEIGPNSSWDPTPTDEKSIGNIDELIKPDAV